MGKRKKAAKKPTGPKKSEPLATVFPCLFCNHEKSVTAKIDRRGGVGSLSCKICGQSFQCQINYLSAAVDVYAEWVDACDAVAKENNEDGRTLQLPTRSPAAGKSGASSHRHEEANSYNEDDGGGYEGPGIVGDDEY